MNRRWICNDVWMDILPHFRRRQLGLKLALLSPCFNALADTHFSGKTTELIIWRPIRICKKGTKAKLLVEKSNGRTVQFPMPKYPMPNKIRFKDLQICYIDHSVIEFLRANQQIFDKAINLDFYIEANDVQPIWDHFIREIWPIFVPNIRHLSLSNGDHLDNLRRLTSSTILTELNQLISIRSDNLLPDAIADDGPNATAGQALAKWLHTPGKDGKPKRFRCCGAESETIEFINNLKEAFLRATISANYVIRLVLFDESTPIEPFELTNGRTNEMLTLAKEKYDENVDEEDDDDDVSGTKYIDLVLKRWQIGKTIQWDDQIIASHIYLLLPLLKYI